MIFSRQVILDNFAPRAQFVEESYTGTVYRTVVWASNQPVDEQVNPKKAGQSI